MRRFWILAILIGISSSFLWSCENQKGDKATFESMQAMRKEISDLRLRIFKLEISKEAHKTVVLDPPKKAIKGLIPIVECF